MSQILAKLRIARINDTEIIVARRKQTLQEIANDIERFEKIPVFSCTPVSLTDKYKDGKTFSEIVEEMEIDFEDLPITI